MHNRTLLFWLMAVGAVGVFYFVKSYGIILNLSATFALGQKLHFQLVENLTFALRKLNFYPKG